MNEVFTLMLIWGGLIVFGAFVMNFATNGLPMKVISVRASMGKKVLISVHALTGRYYRTGTFSGTELLFKARGDKRGEQRRIDIKDGAPLYRSWGVQCLDVDESTNAFFKPNLEGVTGHDAIKVDHLIKRALLAPKIQDRKDIVIILMLVLLILITGYGAYKAYAAVDMLQGLIETGAIGTIQGTFV